MFGEDGVMKGVECRNTEMKDQDTAPKKQKEIDSVYQSEFEIFDLFSLAKIASNFLFVLVVWCILPS